MQAPINSQYIKYIIQFKFTSIYGENIFKNKGV